MKELINNRISDDDIVCFGEKGDTLGRWDREILGIEKRQCGFEEDNTYKAIVTLPYDSNGALKFWKG